MGAWQAARRERAPKRVWRKNCRIVYLKNIQQKKKKKMKKNTKYETKANNNNGL